MFRGEFTKNLYRVGDCLKMGLGWFADLRGEGLARNRKGAFLRGG